MLLMMVALLVIGAFTGFMAGLLGVGGGMMLTPFMTFLFTMAGFPDALVIKMALATSLTTILFTSVTSVRAHHQSGKVRWDIAKPMGLGAFWGTFLGANFASALKSEWLAIFFAVFVGYSAIKMFRTSKPKPSREVPGTASLAAVGSGVGFISSLLGAGGGFLSTPFMVWCNVSMHQAIGTSAALGFPIAAGGLIGYVIAGLAVEQFPAWSVGYIYLPALAACALASLITAPIGAKTSHRMNVGFLKRVFAVLLLTLALYMASRAL